MVANETNYRLRQAVFNLILKVLSPLLPWLAGRPWAWRLKAAFFRVASDGDWLASYGPSWDAPETGGARPLGLLADERGPGRAGGLEALNPPPAATLRLTDGVSVAELLAGLGDRFLRSDAGLIYLTADCRPHELLVAHYAAAMAEHPEVRLWYADEAQITAGGEIKVFCKPAWDPLYYASSGYVGPSFALRGDLAAAILARLEEQGAAAALPQAQDCFDLALQLMADRELIGHIPVPLCSIPSEKFPAPRPVRPVCEPEAALPKASIVIPFRDRLDLLRPCLGSLLELTDYPDFEIILVDNGSRDEDMLSFLRGPLDARIRIVTQDIPFNFSTLVNRGVEAAEGQVLLLLNNDITIISPHWLRALVAWAVRPQVGPVGAKLLYPNGLVQHGGMFSGVGLTLTDGLAPPGLAHVGWPGDSEGYFGLLASPRVMSSVAGAALAVRRDLYQELGGFDEALAVAMNDVDFCLKARQRGLACVWTPESVLIHHESASRKMDRVSPDKMARLSAEWALMRQRWGEALNPDPWYSPNLSSESSYELKAPPGARRPRLEPLIRFGR